MKKLIILSAVIFCTTARINAQTNEPLAMNDLPSRRRPDESSVKTDKRQIRKELRMVRNSEVSDNSKRQFAEDFGNIPADSWERFDNLDEATFIQNGIVTSAFYDDQSQLVGTTTEKKFSDIPLKSQKWINKKYSDYTVKDIIFYDDNEFNETDMEIYNMPFNGDDSYFVELKKNNKEVVLNVNKDGDVAYFLRLN